MEWHNVEQLPERKYTCGFASCNRLVASDKGYRFVGREKNRGIMGPTLATIMICPNCKRPTYFVDKGQTPGIAPGNPVAHLPKDVNALYEEARNCIAANAPTSAVLTCRKLLMSIAVSQGAKANEKFLHYVEHLATNGFVPPNGKGWVDHIRKKSNEANHEIALMTTEDATELVSFAEMLLKFIYEFPNRIPKPPGAQ